MRNKRRISVLLTLLLLFGVLSLTVISANAADELGTALPGDKVAVTGSNGHQYYYTDSAGNSGYYWASYMTVAISERNGADVDYVNGAYKSYYAWCASYGEPVPLDAQEYLLSEGQLDEDGEYYYVDEFLSKDGVKGLKIPFSWALSVIKSAERLAIQNGHAKYDYNGAVKLPVAYRFAVEVAIRCISDEVNANEQDITYGYGSAEGLSRLEDMEWTVVDFYKAVKDIYNGAVEQKFEYEPLIKDINAIDDGIDELYYQNGWCILEQYTLDVNGVTATLTDDTTTGVEAVVNGNILTVRIAKNDIPKENIVWDIELSYTNGQTYTMLFGVPINESDVVLDTPQNIMLYDAQPYTATASVKGESSPWDKDKATITVQKTDTNGTALSGMKFMLYKYNSGTITIFDEEQTDQSGELVWKDLDLGDYFLVEDENAGYAPFEPEEWQIDGATSAVYTTIGGKSGWKISLAPGDTLATVSAVNARLKGTAQVIKTDTSGNPLQGIAFRLYGVNEAETAFTSVLNGTTNANGIINFGAVTAGKYLLVEMYSPTYRPRNPEDWIVNGASGAKYTTIGGNSGWLLTIGAGNDCVVYAVNGKLPTLSLNKIDRDGNPMKDMAFSIYGVTGNTLSFMETFATDENGDINVGTLHIGSYFIVEEQNGKWQAFRPYEWQVRGASSAEYTTLSGLNGWLLYLDAGDTARIEAINDYPVSLTVKKQGSAGLPLVGATFTLEVSYNNGKTFTVVESKTTLSNGAVTFENLDRYAYYRVTETKAPQGCALLGDAVFKGRIITEDITITVSDSLIVMLPSTGGNGTWIATLAAALSVICAGWLIVSARKRTAFSHK